MNPSLSQLFSIPLHGGFQEVRRIEDGSDDILLCDAGGIQRLSIDGGYRWRSEPFGAHGIAGVVDLDRDGQLEIVTTNGREVIILASNTGTIISRYDVGPPLSYGTYAGMIQIHEFFGDGRGYQILVPCFSNKEVLMFDCRQSASSYRWQMTLMHRLYMEDGYHPSIVIGDVNSDGIDEIVIARLGGIYVFDPRTGMMIGQTIWNSDDERRRNYGQVQLADIDNDGELEIIILSGSVSRHIAVLDNDGHGNFTPLWDRFIQHIYPNDTTELRYVANSLNRFRAGPNPQLAVSIFNESGDNRWHTLLLEVATGDVNYSWADRYLRGVIVRNQASAQLILSVEHERTPTYSPLNATTEILTHGTGNHGCRESQWQFAVLPNTVPCPRTVHTIATRSQFKPDVWADHGCWTNSRGDLLCRTISDNSFSLVKVNTDGSHPALLPLRAETDFKIADWTPETLILSYADGILTKIQNGIEATICQTGYHLTPEAHISARPGQEVTTFVLDGQEYIAIAQFGSNVCVYELSSGTPQLKIRIAGRSMLGYDNIYNVISVIETTDGPRIAIVDDHGEECARLTLYSISGERTHTFVWPDMPASRPMNRIGCYHWLPFEHSRGPALFVSFYQSMSMNSECSSAILIESGEELYRLTQTGEGEYGRGIGPWGRAATRTIGNRSVAVFCAKDTLCEVDLETGRFARPPRILAGYTEQAMRELGSYKSQGMETFSSVDDPFTAYGTPIVLGDQTLIAGCFGGFGLLDEHQNAIWWKVASFGDVLYRNPAIADLNGDGQLVLAQSHADGTIRFYDFMTGWEFQRLHIGSIGTDISSVGLNGKMYFVLGTSDGRLLVISPNSNDNLKFNEIAGPCAILEEILMGSGLASPTVSTFGGETCIFVAAADGRLLAFGFR